MEEPKAINDWLKVSILGSGGFGIVSLWRNQKTQEHIAIKKCRWELPGQIPPKQKERWTKEVEIMCAINHPNIVSYRPLPDALANTLSRYNPSRLPFLSMEYCSLGNLRHCLKTARNASGLPEAEVRYILKDLCGAVAYLHARKITHRDLKPENIVLQKTDDRPNETVYKLIDLGYAKELGSLVASFVGTIHYLAPEIFRNEAYSCNVDYWSFGIVAFEVVCGKHPFLPKMNPVDRLDLIQRKSPEDICLYTSRSGEVVFSREILKENHISVPLKKRLEEWLRVVLRYDPKERGATQSGRSVFLELQDILDQKILRVFSVYNYCYYCYEVDEWTLLKTLQEWLEASSGVEVADQLLITENMFYDDSSSRKVFECLDETNASSTMVLFKRGQFVRSPDATIPPVVKNLMKNPDRAYSSGSLYSQIADSVHYISQETDLMLSLKKSSTTLYYYLRNLMKHEADVFFEMYAEAQKVLTQIEVLRHLNSEVTARSAAGASGEHVKKYKQCLWQSRELVENVNAAACRHSKLQARERLLKKGSTQVEDNLGKHDPDGIYNEALTCLVIGNQKAEISSSQIIKVLSKCCQARFKLITNDFMQQYMEVCGKSLKEIQRLLKWMNALKTNMERMSSEIITNEIIMLKKVVNTREPSTFEDGWEDIDDLLQDNINIRCCFQDAMNHYLSLHKEYSIEVEEM